MYFRSCNKETLCKGEEMMVDTKRWHVNRSKGEEIRAKRKIPGKPKRKNKPAWRNVLQWSIRAIISYKRKHF